MCGLARSGVPRIEGGPEVEADAVDLRLERWGVEVVAGAGVGGGVGDATSSSPRICVSSSRWTASRNLLIRRAARVSPGVYSTDQHRAIQTPITRQRQYKRQQPLRRAPKGLYRGPRALGAHPGPVQTGSMYTRSWPSTLWFFAPSHTLPIPHMVTSSSRRCRGNVFVRRSASWFCPLTYFTITF